MPHYSSSCSTSVVQGVIPDHFDSARLKLGRAAGGAEHDWWTSTWKSSCADHICRSHFNSQITLWSQCELVLRFGFAFCNNISVWSSPKVSVADSRYDSIDVLVGGNTAWPAESFKEPVCCFQLRPNDILFAQAWANISEHRDTSWRSRLSQDEEFTYNKGGGKAFISHHRVENIIQHLWMQVINTSGDLWFLLWR